MGEPTNDIGLIGLGVMGRQLALNILDHDYGVTGFDKNADTCDAFRNETRGRRAKVAGDVAGLVDSLKSPRVALILVPAGKAVDSVLGDLTPHLDRGDIVIDAGNSHFTDTNRRAAALDKLGIHLLGAGVSGGAYGARHGPSIMPGGPREAWERVRGILEAVAAKAGDDPCVAWLGPGSAGHYVKMVHNGIEYGLMQLIAESYDLMHRGLGLSDAELHEVYARWNEGDLESFLVGITADIFTQADERTGKPLVDVILDEAAQKGTGAWTSEEALALQAPTPTIDMAVTMRNLSAGRQGREQAERALDGHRNHPHPDRDQLIGQLERGLYAASLLTYAQGMDLLRAASEKYHYRLDLATVASIWREGCIIRAAALEKIRHAYADEAKLESLILDKTIAREIGDREGDLRAVVRAAVDFGLPAPAMLVEPRPLRRLP